MARTINPVIHADRREAYLDAAERLIQRKGYSAMSIQDVLDELDVSRGAFYHYYDSKVELLEGVIERMVDGGLAQVRPVVDDPALDALTKLHRFFTEIARFKTERTDLLRALVTVWMDDDNAIVREKFRQSLLPRLAPLLAGIVEQGEAEHAFVAGDPAGTAQVLVFMLQGLNEQVTRLLLANTPGRSTLPEAERLVEAFERAIERILDLPAGSFQITDPDLLRRWFTSDPWPT